MTNDSLWLRLIEVSGPFVSPVVLDEAFPDGLSRLDRTVRRDLARFYNEWVDAEETRHAKFRKLHEAWIRAVLRDGLGFDDADLLPGGEWTVTGDGGLGVFAPDFACRDIDGAPVLFVKILPVDQKPEDRTSADAWTDSAVEKMVRLCRARGVRLGLVTNGERWTVVNAASGGALSGTATFFARIWFQEDDTLRAFLALLGKTRFSGAKGKTLPALLDRSLEHLDAVTDTLGKQVMTAVEVLLEGFDRADLDANRTLLAGLSPAELYEASLTVMMRLVFILCAEERGLMRLGDPRYDAAYAISPLRRQLERDKDRLGEGVLERRYDAWARILATFRLVHDGAEHPDLRVPAMGGSLFDPDRYPFLEGRSGPRADARDNPPPLPIDNRTVLLLLESLQVLRQKNGAIPLSFRSLDVEQIGYVYEGLLEFTGARADETLLGLKGDSQHLNPEVSLAELESLRASSDDALLAGLRDATGRSASALRNELAAAPDPVRLFRLERVCRSDAALVARVRPFLNILRLSEWGDPVVYFKGTFFVTNGVDRRSTGTHYTPKALTEMLAREALEPVAFDGPARGLPRADWTLKSPDALLDLKVCDVAMGSGAFLVQACRYLADRLVEAWALAEKSGRRIDAEGRFATPATTEFLCPRPDDRLVEARRLVAEKCLYGVDVNPLAVELAKLSLWLVTLARDRPFGFLDHNLRSGDSLLGVTDVRQLTTFRMKPDGADSGNLMTAQIKSAVAQATAEREAIRSARTLGIRDIRLQMQHHDNAERLLANVRAYADFFIGEVFVAGRLTDKSGKLTKKAAARLDAAALDASVLLAPEADAPRAAQTRRRLRDNLAYDLPLGQTAPRRPFHWALEFPEVFAQGGFDAIVGNPPFMGGQHLTGNFGSAYRDYLVNQIADGVKGSADFVAYFYLRAFGLLRPRGIFSLIACNTIAEGDTRQVGLERLVQGATIVAAHPDMPWPGTAGVIISPATVYKGADWQGARRLSDETVDFISPFLSARDEWTPKTLVANEDQSFQGSIVLGLGFTLSEEEAKAKIAADPKNADVLFPYLNGQDLNSDPGQKASRWVINFFDWPLDRSAPGSWKTADGEQRKEYLKSGRVPNDYPERVAADYPDLLAQVEEKVRPERTGNNDDGAAGKWWLHLRARSELYHALGRGGSFRAHPAGWDDVTPPDRVFACSRVSKYMLFGMVDARQVFSDSIVVFASPASYPALLSNLHEAWVRQNGSSLESRLRYTPSDCYETFPFPKQAVAGGDALVAAFDAARREVMAAEGIGLTKLYNRIHDPSDEDGRIAALRALQVKIDEAVREAYGWGDLDLGHGFHEILRGEKKVVRYTISEGARIEVLRRLARLNRERWEEEEAAGLHEKGKRGVLPA